MLDKHAHIIRAPRSPVDWFQRLAAYTVAGISYLLGLFLVQPTLVSILLLTGIYGAWITAYHAGRQHYHRYWFLILFALAGFSLFIPLPATSIYWLPILPTMTACVLVDKSGIAGLCGAGILWLSTGLALSIITHQWDIGGQVILLISFSSTCGCMATISKLALAQRQLQEYSAQVEELSIVRERNRIAREIHDTLGHSLTLLAVQLETATQLEARGDARLHEQLQQAQRVAKTCLTEVRHSVEALRPVNASMEALRTQLHGLVKMDEAASNQPQITLDLEEATDPLSADLCQTLFRCAQEALTNIRKHSHATKVLLRLSTSAEQVELTVLDNGLGNAPSDQNTMTGFGLQGMRERVALLDGTMRAGAEDRGGWRVEVILPRTPDRITVENPTKIHPSGKGTRL